jgi:hypothetical protein
MSAKGGDRHFTVAGSELGVSGGTYSGTPYAAAKKAARVLFAKTTHKKFKFILREKTQGSSKKSYFYEAEIHDLKTPIVIESWKKKDGTPVTITKEVKLRTCHHDEMQSVHTPKSK